MSAADRSGSSRGQDYVWNTAASVMASLSTVLLQVAVTRLLGIEAAGVFALAYAVGQQLQTVGMYEVRTFQVTDARYVYQPGVYVATRIVTVTAMAAGIVGYALVTANGWAAAVPVALVASLRLVDAFEDVLYSEFQRSGWLGVGARASFWRVTAATLLFVVGMALTRSLSQASVVTVLGSTVLAASLFLPQARGRLSLRPVWVRAQVLRLLSDCLPLFLASFLAMYLANAPRFFINRYLDSAEQGYFAILIMPAMVINLLSMVIFRPLLTTMSTAWAARDLDAFTRTVRRGLAACAGAFALTAAATYVLGAPVLSTVYGKDVSGYVPELMVLVTGGAANAASVVTYYALTTMRHQRLVLVGYAVSSGAVTALAVVLVPPLGLLGASLSYAGAMACLAGVFLATVEVLVRRAARR